MAEAGISVNGVELSDAQAMVVRVALTDLLQSTARPDALGEDDHGKSLTKAYHNRTREVLDLILS